MNKKVFVGPIVASVILAACAAPAARPAAPAAGAAPAADANAKWCSGMKIRFFVGGDAGTPFAKIVDVGAKAAEKDLGASVEYVYSGWNNEKMLTQLRDAVAAKPDGIAMMGHAGDDAIMPLAKAAKEAGIRMMYQNVDVPKVRAALGGGYVGSNLNPQGHALAVEAISRLKLDKAKDHILVIGPWGMPGRNIREGGVAEEFTAQGFTVTKADDTNTHGDPSQLQPILTGALLADPAIKVIVHSGSTIGSQETYMKALGKKVGEIYAIGFDVSPEILTNMERGYVQLTSDQQPFLQGYMPILSLCGTWKYDLAPLNVDTGAGFVHIDNYKSLLKLAADGVR